MKKHTNEWYRKECVKVAKLIAKHLAHYKCTNPDCTKTAEQGFQMHGSHILNEGTHHRMSVIPENIMCQCAQHHMHWHGNPLLQDWFDKQFPGRKKELLAMDKKFSKEYIKPNYEEILKTLKETYNNIINA